MRRCASGLLVAALLGAGCETSTPPPRQATYRFDLEETGDVFRWPADRLPVRYWVSPAAGAVGQYVAAGLRDWEAQFLYGEFAGEVVADSAGADVLIRVAGPTPPDVPLTDDPPVDACSGVTFNSYPPDDPTLVGPFLVTLSWDPRNSDTDVVNCLQRATVHELGHTLGLLRHSSSEYDLMYSFPGVKTPSTGDRATVQVLYHTPPDIAPARRPQ